MKPISAAERKRQIRERRRLKQSRVSSLATATTASASSETADGGDIARNNSFADTDFENGRLENNVDQDQDVECSLLHNNIAPNSDVGIDKDTQKESSKTLFSVVMSRSNKDSSSIENDATKDKNNIATTPKAKKKHISPTKSPGGYDVLKALDVANVYNEHLVKIENESGSNQGKNDVEPEDEWMDAQITSKRTHLNSDVTYESSVKENLLDGMEAEIIEETRHMIDRADMKRVKSSAYDEPIGVGVVDWSVKKRLRIESVPGRCLPGTRSAFAFGRNGHGQPLDDGYVNQLAIQYLSNSSMSGNGREPSTAESLEARWRASTMYYQHPSVYPLPPSILQEYAKAEQKMTQWDGNLSSFIRGPRSIYHRLRLAGCGSMGGLGESATSAGEKSKNGSSVSSNSDVPKLLEQRRCEWKGAFASLFNSWRTRLRHLELRNSKYSDGNGRFSSLKDEQCKPPTTGEVLRCSFYLIRPEQVVLFRSCFMPVEIDGQVKQCIMPMIVFSSTTGHLRSMLNSMGIKMRVLSGLESKDNEAEFFLEENLRELDAQIHANGVSGDAESVHAELEAIKWAGVGDGNVTVAQKNKKRKLDDKSFSSPLYCVGYNNCSAVFELFINTCGLSLSPHNSPFEQRFDTDVLSDVPLLLCRSLGPCMHFSLKSLCVSGRRDYGYMNQMSSGRGDHKQDKTDVRTTLELRGPILPCALRDITCSLVDCMLIDKHHTQSLSNQTLKSNATDEGVGSHHFALFLQSHEGECAALGPNPTGLSSASLFNGSKLSVVQNETSIWHECSHGELLNVMVWDIQRANYVSYNSKHLTVSSTRYS